MMNITAGTATATATATGTATLWLSETPVYRDRPTACVGQFQDIDETGAAELLARAENHARAQGAGFLIGPMNGSTWQAYRTVLSSDGSPPFLFEPMASTALTRAFTGRAYEIIGHYSSARMKPNPIRATGAYKKRLDRTGITVRPFDLGRSEQELAALFRVSRQAFADNFLYTPIPEASFLDLYRPVLQRLIPDYVLLAEDRDGALRGFVFGIPDFAQGPTPSQLIVKTYASTYPGLGGYLLDRLHERAAEAGFSAVIHALMHDGNVSRSNSDKYGSVFRRYALYARSLAR